jgi:hypothetical protein
MLPKTVSVTGNSRRSSWYSLAASAGSISAEKKHAYEALAAQITRIVDPQPNVVPFTPAPQRKVAQQQHISQHMLLGPN